jgi:predicted exporter
VFGLVTAPLLVIAAGMEFETDPRAYQDESLPSLKLYEHLAAQMKLTVQPVFLAVPDIRAERRVLQKVRAFVGKDRPFNQIDSLATRFERLSAQPQLERFIGRDGRLYIMLFPSVNPYEAEALKSLVQAVDHVLEACGPDITAYSGGPVLYHHMMELNRQDLKRTGLAAVIIVIVVLGLLVRRPRHFVCALVPLVGGMIWMVAIIRLAGYKFNLANTVAMPLVVGLGIDYGVHVVHRLRTGSVEAAVATTGRAILASALTTAIAFLSLCFAGTSSLVGMGLAAGVGILSCLVWSLVFLPALAGKRRSSEISSP